MAHVRADTPFSCADTSWAKYQYAVLWGTQQQQIEALRRAVFPHNGAQGFAYTQRHLDGFDNLPPTVWKSALLRLLNLDLQTHTYSEALDTWAPLEKAGVNRRIAAKVGSGHGQDQGAGARQPVLSLRHPARP